MTAVCCCYCAVIVLLIAPSPFWLAAAILLATLRQHSPVNIESARSHVDLTNVSIRCKKLDTLGTFVIPCKHAMDQI